MSEPHVATITASGANLVAMTAATSTRPAVGQLIRGWRSRRRCSQQEVSNEVGVSTRHLSCVETGRSRPSPELVLALAEFLEVPLRDRNSMLQAAGHAPRYSERQLDDPALATAIASIQQMLDAHSPYPGVAVDLHWNVVLANDAALVLVAGLPAELLEPQINVYRVCMHPDGLVSMSDNAHEWVPDLYDQLRRSVATTADAGLRELLAEVENYPTVAEQVGSIGEPGPGPSVLVPMNLVFGSEVGENGGMSDHTVLSLFTTITTFGTPRDITVQELSVELFFPADAATAEALRSRSST
ncbi:MAG: helix-turn-helix domain-containing protein [Microthrixaceae bacterium]